MDQNSFKIHVIKLLTIGGTELWKEDNGLKLDSEILNPNDIYRKSKPIKIGKDIYLCEVDTEKTNISDFYKWDELDIQERETFCWRNYVFLTGHNNENWLSIPKNEKLGHISIQDIVEKIVSK